MQECLSVGRTSEKEIKLQTLVVSYLISYTCPILRQARNNQLPSLKLTARTWKLMVGRWQFLLGRPMFRGYVGLREVYIHKTALFKVDSCWQMYHPHSPHCVSDLNTSAISSLGFLRGIPGATQVHIPLDVAVVIRQVSISVRQQVIGDWRAQKMLPIRQGESLLQWQKKTLLALLKVQTCETSKN